MLQFGLTRNKDSVILRPIIYKRNKRPLLALKNQISARALIRTFTQTLVGDHGNVRSL